MFGCKMRPERTCDHQISFCAAEDANIQQAFGHGLGKGELEKAVEGILDVLFIQTTVLVYFSARRGNHRGKENSDGWSVAKTTLWPE